MIEVGDEGAESNGGTARFNRAAASSTQQYVGNAPVSTLSSSSEILRRNSGQVRESGIRQVTLKRYLLIRP